MARQVRLLVLFVFALSTATSTSVQAWGPKGHRLTAYIAQLYLTPEAKSAIREIMGSDDLASFVLYLDINKDKLDEKIPGSRDWHYDDKPVCSEDAKTYAEYCPDGNCASSKIPKYFKELADEHSSKSEKRFAIQVITHLIGDIHQPLHASDHDDVGGNQIKVRLPWSDAPKKQLHGFWDSDVINRLYENKNEREVAKSLVEKYKDSIPAWQTKREKSWLNETYQISVNTAYGKLPGFSCGAEREKGKITLTKAYLDEAETIIPEQLVKGGVRMALVLNRAFAE